ncbi:MAG TPA: hypothetical protein VF602_12675 [Pedobacter sp.]|jgi:hypothetical protein
MDYICTWLCADEKGEESIFPQTGQKSSSQSHQNIYWRCLILFFATSRRFNKKEKHVLFTNVKHLPEVDGKKVSRVLKDLHVEVIFTDFKYKTPKGYFEMFQNQFYEFSILEYITEHNKNPDDKYLILDSDCIFLRSAQELFADAKESGFLSFEDPCTTELVIHGLSRKDMKVLYEDLLQEKVDEIPGYHLGEFFLASVKNINTIFADFLELWPELLRRFEQGLPKFNEEAQTLSYLYYKNGFKASPKTTLLKRIWTNPVFYRNVEPADVDIAIWHLPAEKQFGLADLYQILINTEGNYGFNLSDKAYVLLAQKTLGIPQLSMQMKLKYYFVSFYRALRKRAKKKLTLKAAAAYL